jgi:hypothetical protein
MHRVATKRRPGNKRVRTASRVATSVAKTNIIRIIRMRRSAKSSKEQRTSREKQQRIEATAM